MLASPTFSGFGNLSRGLLRAGTTKFKHHAILSGHGFVGKQCPQVVALLVCPIFARSSLCLLCSIQIRRLPVFNRIIPNKNISNPWHYYIIHMGGIPSGFTLFLGGSPLSWVRWGLMGLRRWSQQSCGVQRWKLNCLPGRMKQARNTLLSQEMGQQAVHEDQQEAEGHTQKEHWVFKGCGQEDKTRWYSFSVACLDCLNTILLNEKPWSWSLSDQIGLSQLRSGGPALKKTQVYPRLYGKRVCAFHRAFKARSYFQCNVGWNFERHGFQKPRRIWLPGVQGTAPVSCH